MERTEAEKAAERLALQVLELDRNTLLVHLRFLDRALSRLSCVPGSEALSTDKVPSLTCCANFSKFFMISPCRSISNFHAKKSYQVWGEFRHFGG